MVVLASVLTLVLMQLSLLSSACAANVANSPPDVKRVLAFLNDVVGLDMAKYEATLTAHGFRDYSDDAYVKTGYVETSGQYSLQYWDNQQKTYSLLHVNFRFANSTLVSCNLYVDHGNTLYRLPVPSNLVVAAEEFLERYEAFTGDRQLSTIKGTLSNVDSTKNSTKTVDNLQLDVSVTSHATSFRWKSVFNGIELLGVSVSFKDGAFKSFGDDRSLYALGSTNVNITREQAIEIALKRAGTNSFNFSEKLTSNFTVVEDQILTELRVRSKNSSTALYPFWAVYLPLREIYHNLGLVIRVEIWADNGEVINCQTLSFGVPPPVSTSSPSLSTEPSVTFPLQTTSTSPSNLLKVSPELTQFGNRLSLLNDAYLMVAVASAIAVVVVALLVIKKTCR